MRNLTIKLLLPLLFLTTTITAQEYKFGDVTVDELQEASYPGDEDAKAAILYKSTKLHYEYDSNDGWYIVTEFKQRTKIYDQEGVDWATKTIPLYVGRSAKESVSGLKAYTYNLEGGKVEKTKLKRDGIFDEKVNKYRNARKFTMPAVKAGSVVEWEYEVKSPFFSSIDEVQLQYSIPVKEIYAKIDIPQYFVYKRHAKGYFPIKFQQTQENREIKVVWRGNRDVHSGVKERNESTLDFTENVYKISARNVPSMKGESYVNNIRNYMTSMKFELASTQFPNSSYRNYSTSWEEVAKSIYKYDSFGKQLKENKYFRDDIDALIEGVSDPMKKAALIFNHVKNRMKWNSYYGMTTDEGVKKAYNNKTGNVAEINLMLTAMLRYAGLNSNPVLVSTRSNGIPLFPTQDGFNYVISAIEVTEDVILLDATSKYSLPNVLPVRALNWNGRIVRKEGSSAPFSLIPKVSAKQTYLMAVELDDLGAISGRMRIQRTNHEAYNFRRRFIGADQDEYLTNLENAYSDIEVENHQVKNEKELGKPVMESFEFISEDLVEKIGDKLYINPLLFLQTNENPFKSDTRDYPIDFVYPRELSYRITVKIPEGYTIESAPESMAIALPDGMGSYSYNSNTNGNMMQLSVGYKINTAVVPSTQYQGLKEFFNKLVEKETEKVVLKKI